MLHCVPQQGMLPYQDTRHCGKTTPNPSFFSGQYATTCHPANRNPACSESTCLCPCCACSCTYQAWPPPHSAHRDIFNMSSSRQVALNHMKLFPTPNALFDATHPAFCSSACKPSFSFFDRADSSCTPCSSVTLASIQASCVCRCFSRQRETTWGSTPQLTGGFQVRWEDHSISINPLALG